MRQTHFVPSEIMAFYFCELWVEGNEGWSWEERMLWRGLGVVPFAALVAYAGESCRAQSICNKVQV